MNPEQFRDATDFITQNPEAVLFVVGFLGYLRRGWGDGRGFLSLAGRAAVCGAVVAASVQLVPAAVGEMMNRAQVSGLDGVFNGSLEHPSEFLEAAATAGFGAFSLALSAWSIRMGAEAALLGRDVVAGVVGVFRQGRDEMGGLVEEVAARPGRVRKARENYRVLAEAAERRREELEMKTRDPMSERV